MSPFSVMSFRARARASGVASITSIAATACLRASARSTTAFALGLGFVAISFSPPGSLVTVKSERDERQIRQRLRHLEDLIRHRVERLDFRTICRLAGSLNLSFFSDLFSERIYLHLPLQPTHLLL